MTMKAIYLSFYIELHTFTYTGIKFSRLAAAHWKKESEHQLLNGSLKGLISLFNLSPFS